jgi:hypothetical protein
MRTRLPLLRGALSACGVLAFLLVSAGPAWADPPTCNDIDSAVITPPGVAVDTAPDCTDPDAGDTLTYAISTQPDNGTAAVVDGKLEYTPASGFLGTDSFQYTANDGTSDSEPASVFVFVDTPPACANLHGTVQSGKSLPIPVTDVPCYDPDPDAELALFVDDGPHHGTLEINDAGDVATYTPSPGFVGTDTILYSATDEFGVVSDEGTGTITVTPPVTVTPPPVHPRDTTPPAVTLLHPRQRIRNARAHGVAVRATSSEPGTLSVAVSVDKRTARKLKINRRAHGRVVIGRLTQPIAAGATTVHVKLSRRARTALKHARKVKLRISVVITDAAGNAATPTPLAVTLRR